MHEDIDYTAEFDMIIELVISVIFMSFCIFATAYMISVMTPRVNVSYDSNKLSTKHVAYAKDPYYLSPYEAYMMSWHMDTISTTPLMYLGSNLSTHNPGLANDADNDVCATGDMHLIMSVMNRDTGLYRENFINWRNRHITGVGIDAGKPSVQSMINKSLLEMGLANNNTAIKKAWQGAPVGDSLYSYHLECTYANMEPSRGSDRRRDSIWQLTPVIISP